MLLTPARAGRALAQPHTFARNTFPSRVRPSRSLFRGVRAQRTQDAYVQELSACETSGDWMKTFELVTEANILKVSLPGTAIEASIRTFATGGQWQKAADLFDTLTQGGHHPDPTTVHAVFAALSVGKQADRSQQMLTRLEKELTPAALSPAYNVVLRTVARSGHSTQAYDMLEKLIAGKTIVIDHSTYTVLAAALIKSGDQDKAEEVLEMRDYL